MQNSPLTPLRIVITVTAVVLALGHVLFPGVVIDHITLVLLAFALIPWLTPLVKSLEFPGGWKVELRNELQRELEVVATGTLHRLAALDARLIAYWEKNKSLQPGESVERLSVIEEAVRELESEFAKASHLERLGIGLALRTVYWEYLNRAREHFASSKQYQEIKARVLAGLKKIEENDAPAPAKGAV